MGVSLCGKFLRDEEDPDPIEDGLIDNDDVTARPEDFFQTLVAKKVSHTQLSGDEESILEWIQNVTEQERATLFFPPMLQPGRIAWMETNTADTWCTWAKSETNQLLVLKFFHSMNDPQFMQQIFPQGTCKNSYFRLDSTKREKAHKPESVAVRDHQRPVTHYSSTDFRYSDNRNLSSLAGDWVKNINPENPKSTGLSGLKGFKGIIDIDKYHSYFDGGIELLEQLLNKHPIVGIDLGLTNLISMVVMDAKVGYFISLTIDLTIDLDKT